MPMYEFTVPADNEVVEVFLSMADFDKRVIDGKITLDDGREAVYEWQQHNKMRSVPANYPMVCDFVGRSPGSGQGTHGAPAGNGMRSGESHQGRAG
jgi:hypothetical protein